MKKLTFVLLSIVCSIGYSQYLTCDSTTYFNQECEDDKLIEYTITNDSIVLVIEYQEKKLNTWDNYFIYYDCVTKVKKIVIYPKEIKVIKGEIIPKKIIDRHYKFKD